MFNYGLFGGVFIEGVSYDDQALSMLLKSKGFDSNLVEKYAILTPIAFGRFYMNLKYSDLVFSESYLYGPNRLEYKLSEDDVYIWSLDLVNRNLDTSVLSDAACIAITNRSPEIKGMIQAVSEGKTINGTQFNTVITLG